MWEENQSGMSQGHRTGAAASRVQETLAENTGQIYHRAYKSIKELSDVLITATEESQPYEYVSDLFEEWKGRLQDLYEYEQEYRRFISSRKIDAHDKRFRKRIDLLCEVRAQVRVVLEQLTLQDNRNNSAKAHSHVSAAPSLGTRAGDIAESIRRVQSDITLTQARLTQVRRPREDVTEAHGDVEVLVDSTKQKKKTRSVTQVDENSSHRAASVTESLADTVTTQQSVELSTIDVLNRLASVIAETKKKKNRLPAMEPTVFDGDLLKFPLWLTSVEGLMETQAETVPERLHYLGKYTSGSAHDAISGYLGLQADDAYVRAKEVLVSKFGDPIRISDAYKSKLSSWPAMRRSDPIALGKFADFLWQCHAAIDSVGHLDFLSNSDENIKLAKKLPTFISDRWNRIIHTWRYGSERDRKEGRAPKGVYPPFKEFCSFVAEEARVAEGPCNFHADTASTSTPKESKKKAVSFSTQSATSPPKSGVAPAQPYCRFCKGAHWIDVCTDWFNKPAEERKEHATKNNMCFGCLRKGHSCKDCRHRNPNLMSDVKTDNTNKEQMKTARVNQLITENETLNSMIVPIVLSHPDNPALSVEILCLLDTQSDCCLLKESVAKQLNVQGDTIDLKLVTMATQQIVKSKVVTGLRARGLDECVAIDLPKCYTRVDLPYNKENIPKREEVARWPHLAEVARNLPGHVESMEIGLLIGFNCSAALMPQECVSQGIDKPYGIKTVLGWSVVGNVGNSQPVETRSSFCYSTQSKEMTVSSISEMFDRGFQDASDERVMSVNDNKFVQIVDEGIRKEDDGHYSLPLPFRQDQPNMPDNRIPARRSFDGLMKRLSKNPVAKGQYFDFMGSMLAQGHAEKALPLTAEDAGKFNFVEHHGVQHPRKPGKTRVVFNVSREYQGKCLNQELLTGPDFINNLTGVLIRFRQELIAISCDVKGMFYQVKVHEQDRNYLRFFWFEDNDPCKEVIEYRMVVQLFGATSSPGVANFTFRRLAEDQRDNYDDEVINFILHDFYVDDGLTSVTTVNGAVTLILQSHDLCKQGGFWLQKYLSNSKEVMAAVPEELRIDQLQNVDLTMHVMDVERSLGVEWCLELDAFQFRITISYKPATRRNMLSCVSSIYDPLGLVSPITLRGRRLVQIVCRDGGSWDDPVPEDTGVEWQEWLADLENLASIKIDRCYKKNASAEMKSVQLHHFCDACETGYGACSYVRIEDVEGHVDVALVMAKTRVTPNKPVTIPRLELQSAVLATQLSTFVNKEMSYENIANFYWTDSMVTMGYLNNDAKRFQIFVANRIQKIHAVSDKTQWSHVSTKINPADIASRGATVSELREAEIWWKGPKMLEKFDATQAREPTAMVVSDDDPEIRRKAVVHQLRIEDQPLLVQQANRFSSWSRYIRVIVRCVSYIRKLKSRVARRFGRSYSNDTVSDVNLKVNTEKLVLKQLQEYCFDDLLKQLKVNSYPDTREQVHDRKKSLKATTNLYKLDPYISQDGLLRVGGRIRRANVSRDIAHPILVPSKQHISELLIQQFHMETAHAGAGTTVNQMRASGYWLLRARSTVARLTRNCVGCLKLRGGPVQQRMSDLPVDRLTPAPPFTYCGVDFCGPFLVTQARSERKRWICVFICMVSKCMHLEVVPSLTTNGFLNAYRRFVCRRGPIRVLRCDRGTNFVGAKGEMEVALKEMDQDKIQANLLKDNCDWIQYEFNVPQASHMGGMWERAIGSFRRSLEGLLAEHSVRLDDELLTTLVAEAECIGNSQPITYVDTASPEAGEPLTPQMLLTLKHKVVQPFPGRFVRADLYCRRRWRCVQYLANQFWLRWRREFLPALQERVKWQRERVNLQIDDVVLIIEDNLPRNQWMLGRITELIASDDNLVRKVVVKTHKGSYERPVVKLVLLMPAEVQTTSESQ